MTELNKIISFQDKNTGVGAWTDVRKWTDCTDFLDGFFLMDGLDGPSIKMDGCTDFSGPWIKSVHHKWTDVRKNVRLFQIRALKVLKLNFFHNITHIYIKDELITDISDVPSWIFLFVTMFKLLSNDDSTLLFLE